MNKELADFGRGSALAHYIFILILFFGGHTEFR